MKIIFVLFVMLTNYSSGKSLHVNRIKVELQIPLGLSGILDTQSLAGLLMGFSHLELMAHILMELILVKIIH
jgi:hypothetical protein